MSVELRLALAFALAFGLTLAATPVAIRVAVASGFYDWPGGAKGHAAATPYLGGAAVLVGLLGAGSVLGAEIARLWPILTGVALLWAVGTVDDRVGLDAGVRVLAELAVGLLLWFGGLGWSLPVNAGFNLALSLLWVVGVCNAFNLLDNLDGAAATTAAVASLGVAVVAVLHDAPAVAVLALGLSGSCAAFLINNLASPARIFLGDGGSLVIGFATAATVMALPLETNVGSAALVAGILLAGVPILDTALVVVSRARRGISPMIGGRDHLAHRLLPRLRSARRVSLALAIAQVVLCVVAVVAVEAGKEVLILACVAYVGFGGGAIAWLDRPSVRSPGWGT